MLTSLRIRHLAVVEDLGWELEYGLNILTGETGAGKSILIDAFELLLGERADRGMIRDGEDSCTVEGLIQAAQICDGFLEDNGIDVPEEGELLIKRIFYRDKNGKQWINGSPVTLQILKGLGDLLVDMHGPHDHQSLLSVEKQLEALDEFGGSSQHAAAYRKTYRSWQKATEELESMKQLDSGGLEQRLDFLNHQIGEIESAELNLEEEQALEEDFERASHQQRILEVYQHCMTILSEGEGSVLDQLARVQRLLEEWENMDPGAGAFRETNEGLVATVNELLRELEHLSSRAEMDSGRLAELENRLDLVKSLKRKYGGDIEVVLEKCAAMIREREDLGSLEQTVAELEAQAETLRVLCLEQAATVSRNRKKAAPKLAKAITDQLRELGFNQSTFEVRLDQREEPGVRGMDDCEFFFAPNPGEGIRPLRTIASSGEMARVMLAVKTVLAAADQVPILVFDEVDANVGGETAVSVGKRLRELAGSHQVLCITHLPQVAAAGHAHYRVEKQVEAGRTRAVLNRLSEDEREEELARMLGGKTDSARKLARSLLNESG